LGYEPHSQIEYVEYIVKSAGGSAKFALNAMERVTKIVTTPTVKKASRRDAFLLFKTMGMRINASRKSVSPTDNFRRLKNAQNKRRRPHYRRGFPFLQAVLSASHQPVLTRECDSGFFHLRLVFPR
jgi:hypothetical protein